MATLAEGRYLACYKFPYLAHGLIGLIPVAQEGIGTLATTKESVMYYDPVATSKWTAEELAGGLVHECMHLILDHFTLAAEQKANPLIWNLAGDLVINQMILASGCKIVQGAVIPDTFKVPPGLTVYEYYNLLLKQAKKITVNVCCGSAAGNPHPIEGSRKEGKEGRSKAEIEVLKRQVAKDIQEHAKKNGKLPAELARWADAILTPPKISWQQKLRALARQSVAYSAGKVDLKWGAISKRQWGIGLGNNLPILPSYKAPIPRVAIAIDTSGSMSEKDLISAVSEAKAILDQTSGSVDLIVCDAEVHAHRKIKNVSEIKKSLKGGGGTDFNPVFEGLKRERPDVLVFATDGCGPAPASAPSFKVIWLLIGQYAQKPFDPSGNSISYGEFVRVD
jgi:predicted metal-dependent peptidase